LALESVIGFPVSENRPGKLFLPLSDPVRDLLERLGPPVGITGTESSLGWIASSILVSPAWWTTPIIFWL
jgi:hypothetical protein